MYECRGAFCAHTHRAGDGESHTPNRGQADGASCHSLFLLPDRAASAAACFELDVGQESQFFFSVTILQVHVFGNSREREVQKELVWVDRNNKNRVVFPPSSVDIKKNHPRKDILNQKSFEKKNTFCPENVQAGLLSLFKTLFPCQPHLIGLRMGKWVSWVNLNTFIGVNTSHLKDLLN